MAIREYDEAVASKIQSWLPKSKKSQDRRIQVLKPDETRKLFAIELDEKNDKPVTLPLIALSRDTTVDILQKTMVPMSFDGLLLEASLEKGVKLNAIPIGISYQMDLYTRRYDEGDELVREFLFKFINNPQIVIEIPYNDQKLKHVSSIIMRGQVEDTSDIPERRFSGQFTRWTFRFDISGAYLFNVPVNYNVKIDTVALESADNRKEPYEYQLEDVIKLGSD